MEYRDKGRENEAFKKWHEDIVSFEAVKFKDLACQLYRHVFEQGYSAGLTEGRKFAAALGEAGFETTLVAAPANSPLGIELSKIRDRLNALEEHSHWHGEFGHPHPVKRTT